MTKSVLQTAPLLLLLRLLFFVDQPAQSGMGALGLGWGRRQIHRVTACFHRLATRRGGRVETAFLAFPRLIIPHRGTEIVISAMAAVEDEPARMFAEFRLSGGTPPFFVVQSREENRSKPIPEHDEASVLLDGRMQARFRVTATPDQHQAARHR